MSMGVLNKGDIEVARISPGYCSAETAVSLERLSVAGKIVTASFPKFSPA